MKLPLKRQVSFSFFRTGRRLKEQSIESFSDEELLSQVNPRRIYIYILYSDPALDGH